jgi:hypothetical protein
VAPGELDPDLNFEDEKYKSKPVVAMHDSLQLQTIRNCLKDALEFLGFDVRMETSCDD